MPISILLLSDGEIIIIHRALTMELVAINLLGEIQLGYKTAKVAASATVSNLQFDDVASLFDTCVSLNKSGVCSAKCDASFGLCKDEEKR